MFAVPTNLCAGSEKKRATKARRAVAEKKNLLQSRAQRSSNLLPPRNLGPSPGLRRRDPPPPCSSLPRSGSDTVTTAADSSHPRHNCTTPTHTDSRSNNCSRSTQESSSSKRAGSGRWKNFWPALEGTRHRRHHRQKGGLRRKSRRWGSSSSPCSCWGRSSGRHRRHKRMLSLRRHTRICNNSNGWKKRSSSVGCSTSDTSSRPTRLTYPSSPNQRLSLSSSLKSLRSPR